MRSRFACKPFLALTLAAAGCAGRSETTRQGLLNPEDGRVIGNITELRSGSVIANSENDIVATGHLEIHATCPVAEKVHLDEARFRESNMELGISTWGLVKWLGLELLLSPVLIIADLIALFVDGQPFQWSLMLLLAQMEWRNTPETEIRIEHDVEMALPPTETPILRGVAFVFVEAESRADGSFRLVALLNESIGPEGIASFDMRSLSSLLREDDCWLRFTAQVDVDAIRLPSTTFRIKAADIRSLGGR